MDQLSAMRAFVRVARSGSFSAAAREQNSSQATVSKKVAALETKLGAKLITRSSRDQSLTQAGEEYYNHCSAVIAEIDEVDAKVRSLERLPTGLLRIAVPVPFGRLVLAPLMGEFLQKFPEIQIELHIEERNVDLISDGLDIAVRARNLEDSSLVARALFDSPMLLTASPSYLSRYGEPQKPHELQNHNCIAYTQNKSLNSWNFTLGDLKETIPISGSFRSNSAETNLGFVLSGEGIAQLPVWMLHEHIHDGRLVQVLSDYQSDSMPFNVIYPQNRYMPLKVRCFIEFIMEKLDGDFLLQGQNPPC